MGVLDDARKGGNVSIGGKVLHGWYRFEFTYRGERDSICLPEPVIEEILRLRDQEKAERDEHPLPEGWRWIKVSVPVSEAFGEQYVDGRGLAIADAAKCEAMRSRCAELERKLTAVIRWLEHEQPDVFKRGMWDAIGEAQGDGGAA